MKNIEIGTLVRYYEDGDFGIVTKVIQDGLLGVVYRVEWFDGNITHNCTIQEMEVICK